MPYALIGKWVGGIVAGLILAWALYAGIIRPVTKPNPLTKNEAEVINNYYNQPRISFGCANFQIKNGEEKDNTTSNSLPNNSNSL